MSGSPCGSGLVWGLRHCLEGVDLANSTGRKEGCRRRACLVRNQKCIL